jgi:hypothetical protein
MIELKKGTSDSKEIVKFDLVDIVLAFDLDNAILCGRSR